MPIKITIAPASEPVSLDEAKLHLRVDGTDDDAWITRAIKAARMWCETRACAAFVTQTAELALERFPTAPDREAPAIVVPLPPLSTVTSVQYYDAQGVLQTLDASKYQVDAVSQPGRILPAPGTSWPATQSGRIDAVKVTFVCGVASDQVDPRVPQAILMLVGHWYEHRESFVTGTIATEIQEASAALMAQLWHGRLS